jgi:hypothetical protein
MNKQQILDLAKRDPRYGQAVAAINQNVGQMNITPDGVDELVTLLEFAINHPEKYGQIRAAAIKDGMVDESDMPVKPDPVFLVSMLVALYSVQDGQHGKKFARGGLAQAAKTLKSKGRNGDTMLAHINPAEADMLRRAGGSGAINPSTGLPEYGFLSSLFKVLVPIALSIFAPGVGTAIGSSLGATGAWASALGGAVIGGATSALTGGNIAQGALMGGLGGGLGGAIGGLANDTLGLNLGDSAKSLIGGGLAGAAMGAATGQGALKGAATGAAGAWLGDTMRGWSGDGAAAQNAPTEATSSSPWYAPQTEATQPSPSSLFDKYDTSTVSPSDAVISSLKDPAKSEYANLFDTGTPESKSLMLGNQDQPQVIDYTSASTDAWSKNRGIAAGIGGSPTDLQGNIISPGTDITGGGVDAVTGKKPAESSMVGKIMGGLQIASGLSSLSKPPESLVATMTPEQKAYMNRPSLSIDWAKMQADANNAGMGLQQYMSTHWNEITATGADGKGGAYSIPNIATPKPLARGGALNSIAFARGAGSGRDDTISAKLSDGEYVIDAETVALLGDGSSAAGAQRLDKMREDIRAHKGRALSKGKISPNAKTPTQYIKGGK